MKVLQVLRIRKYGIIAVLSAAVMALAYPYLQVALNGGFSSYAFWFKLLISESALNVLFYAGFSILFGIVISLNVYNLQNKTCSVKGSFAGGSFGSVLGIFTSQCSACLSLASVFFPTAAVVVLAKHNTLFNFISVAILILSIYLSEGFKK